MSGGAHPGARTRNALLSFDDRAYLEIIAVDPDQSNHHGPRPFRIADGCSPRLASFAVHPVDGETIEAVAGRMLDLEFDPGPVTAMSRLRPDGVELSWRLTRAAGSPLGLADPPSDGVIPFVIDWGPTPTPTPARPTLRVGRLVEIRITHHLRHLRRVQWWRILLAEAVDDVIEIHRRRPGSARRRAWPGLSRCDAPCSAGWCGSHGRWSARC